MNHRAYSVLDVKSVDDEQRVIRGIATTPTPDRVRDVVDPMGVKVAADIPLFLHHDSRQVVGRAMFGQPSKKGIPFEARLPKVEETGTLRDRVDEAWQSVKYRLITGVSIGFKPVLEKMKQLDDGGLYFGESEVLELSLVPIPMNAEAVITQFRSSDGEEARAGLLAAIKSADREVMAALGRKSIPFVRIPPGASGTHARKGVVYFNPKG